MTNKFSSDGILYYPTIEFQDTVWIKSVLVFWDKIYRIVPRGYSPVDSNEVYIAKREGLIVDINLSSDDLEKTAEEFEKFCDKLDFYPSGFDASLYQVRLHSDKIDERLKPFFAQFSKSLDKEGFYKIPEKIANGYMFFLSDTVSKRRDIPKLTDNPDMFAAMSYFDAKGDFGELFINEDAEDIYTTLVIENLIPADIRSLSIDEIIKINKDLSEYKKEFRKNVSEFSDKLSKVQDKEFAIKEIERFKKEISEVNVRRVEVFKTYLNELRPSLLFVGLPVCATSIIGSVFKAKQEMFSIIAEVGKGILLGAVASFGNAGKDIRKRWTSKRSNYYLELQRHWTSSDRANIKITDMTKRLDEFIND